MLDSGNQWSISCFKSHNFHRLPYSVVPPVVTWINFIKITGGHLFQLCNARVCQIMPSRLLSNQFFMVFFKQFLQWVQNESGFWELVFVAHSYFVGENIKKQSVNEKKKTKICILHDNRLVTAASKLMKHTPENSYTKWKFLLRFVLFLLFFEIVCFLFCLSEEQKVAKNTWKMNSS